MQDSCKGQYIKRGKSDMEALQPAPIAVAWKL